MKLYKWRQSRRTLLPSALLAGLCLMPAAAHSASSYLQELEAEAARSDTEQGGQQQAPKAGSSEWTPEGQNLSEKIEAGLKKEEFEQRLKQSYYGSYLFYSTLNDADQQLVYKDYQQNNAINSIRESIKTHMKSE